MTKGFNLVHEPWVLVLDERQRCREVSLVDVFTNADRWRGLAGEIPTQQAAVLRFLLAICHRSLRQGASPAQATHRWGVWWRDGFPIRSIVGYLHAWEHRFDLFDDHAPFMQVADLHTAKGSTSGLSKLIAEIPDGEPYFTTRAGSGLHDISAAEAARWIIHCQAYDISGIKTGAAGDDRVKGGRGYPIGTGWCGQIGMVVAEGNTLAETLLLNLVLEDPSPEGDLAPWERDPPLTAAVDSRLTDPARQSGPVERLVWQSRRLRVFADSEGHVIDALVCNGDLVRGQNKHRSEAMTAWRRSANQEKRGDHGPVVYMPVTHQPERAVWRGLGGLLAGTNSSRVARDESPRLLPGLVSWLARLVDEKCLDADYPVRFRTVGMDYGAQSSSVSGVIDDVMSIHAAVLVDQDLRQAVVEAVESTDQAVRAVRNLASNLAEAAGSSPDGVRERVAERAWNTLDSPFRHWAADLVATTSISEALTNWHRTAHGNLWRIGQDLVTSASEKAWRGREVSNARGSQFIDTPSAEVWFRAALDKALDRASQRSESSVTSNASAASEGN